MYSQEEIAASRAAWSEWERRGRTLPFPDVPEYLSFSELAGRYGEYTAANGALIPVLPGHVRLIDFICPVCREESPGFLEYGGTLVCSKECAAVALAGTGLFSDGFVRRALISRDVKDKIKRLEQELEQLRSGGGQ